MRPLRPTAALLVLTAVLATSCSAQRDVAPPAPARAAPATPTTPTPVPSTTPTPSPSVADVTMTIRDFTYVVPATVPAGAQVTVVNEDREAHTVTVDRGAVRLTVLPGATAVFTAPAEPGSHPLTCDLHGGMDAVLVVV